jgi:hypothetical protein
MQRLPDARHARVLLGRALQTAGVLLGGRTESADVQRWWGSFQAADLQQQADSSWAVAFLKGAVGLRDDAAAYQLPLPPQSQQQQQRARGGSAAPGGAPDAGAGAGLLSSGVVRLPGLLQPMADAGVRARDAALMLSRASGAGRPAPGSSGGGGGGAAGAALGCGLRWTPDQAAQGAAAHAAFQQAAQGGGSGAVGWAAARLAHCLVVGIEQAASGPTAAAQQLLMQQVLVIVRHHAALVAAAAGDGQGGGGGSGGGGRESGPAGGAAAARAPAWVRPGAAAASAQATCRLLLEVRRQLGEASWGPDAQHLVGQAILACGVQVLQVRGRFWRPGGGGGGAVGGLDATQRRALCWCAA